ncbi:MAG: nucleoside triphosphate pyrophosphohydrolase, partial [Dehalococcoidia bacterium]|nr:nucleoside triphosphate pyrophosphohydrolase [Dehalococcoidia bacterium]
MAIEVVGLGPGGPQLLTEKTRALLASERPVLLRTRHHPTVAALDPEHRWADCDDLYESGMAFAELYAAIAARVLARGRSGALVYAVPGHPLVAEESVAMLLRQAQVAGVALRLHPAVSFADAAAVALGRDLSGTQLCDALALRIDAQRPALISQVFDRDTATGLKLALLEVYPPEHEVTLLHAVGSAEEEARRLPLAELDHGATGYLDALFVPPLAPEADVRRFDGLWAIVERLHAPEGCPWDREQTHASLRPHLLEESYEALEAIDSGDPARLAEELGDVLLQVLMHAAVAQREGTFGLADVVEQIARKLVRRHPHVFGETEARNAEEVYRNWEALKQAEKPRSSVLEGVPASLPALAASQSIQGRARRVGFDWPDVEGPLEKLREEVEEFARADGAEAREDEFGDILFVLANVAQRLGVDAEQALRRANE